MNNLLEQIKTAKPKQWIRFGSAALAYFLFIVWVGNFWWLLLLPLIFDAYVTKCIPWTWWKKSENKAIRGIMSWVDAIVYALIAVYFINNFVFQNYQIPTSSLEKSLLVGDYLYVSKCTYGPRIPNTPLSMPLAQHTLPFFNCKSYIETPQWEYRRLKGLRGVERNDIVVFNFPAGDTVTLKEQNPDYYTSAYMAALYSPEYMNGKDRSADVDYAEYQRRLAFGRKYIQRNEVRFGELIWRPVDRRENYVKRCVGMPGDTLELRAAQVYINGKAEENPSKMQLNYFVETDGTRFTNDMMERLSISVEDRGLVTDPRVCEFLGMDPESAYGRNVYHFPLTQEAFQIVSKLPFVKKVVMEPEMYESTIYPLAYSNKWTRDNYGPLWIPKKGATIALTEDNVIRYERVIANYEQNTLEYKNGVAYVNGKPAYTYTFKMDYYFMMGDNRHNSADSRAWGFVPEDHVVGNPVVVWLSLDKDKGLFNGKIRWSRLFTWVKSIK